MARPSATAQSRRTLESLPTPALVLDLAKLDANVARLRAALAADGTPPVLRLHVKTAKSLDLVARVLGGVRAPLTVSTLAEAEAFARAGYRDILYAVGVIVSKVERVAALRAETGVDLAVTLDSQEVARGVATSPHARGLPVLIEIDSDGHRAGVAPGDAERLRAIARELAAGGCEVRGVMTHAGESYNCGSVAAIRAIARVEQAAVVEAARVLRADGHVAPVVSVGSTPTALHGAPFDGVTEVRAGVFTHFDLVMAGLGVCTLDEIAVSVATRVIGGQADRGWTLVDAGWMALSRDRGTARQAVDRHYGLVCDAAGRVLGDRVVRETNQEHGVIAAPPGRSAAAPLAPGTLLRVLPNHACATAAQHDGYWLVDSRRDPTEVLGYWPRLRGW